MTDLRRTAASLEPLFRPRSVAVLGASDNPNKIGGLPVKYFRECGFTGPVYPINPARKTVQGLKSYPDIEAVEGPVDVAILAVPSAATVEAAEQCARKGVKAIVVFTADFAETGDEGRRKQKQLVETAKAGGMRLLGPNCLGYFSTGSHVYGTFTTSIGHGQPKPGRVGVVSQSGAFGSHCFVLGREKGLGFSHWVTTGNEGDIDVADCIAFLAEDAETAVIAGYLEGCQDGAKLRAALELAFLRRKPVVIQKVGRSAVGTEAAASHTASLTGADQVYDALFKRYNVHRARTAEELIDIAYACSAGIYPAGNRIALATISGGAGVLMADAAADVGLDVTPLTPESQRKLRALLPFSAVRNPVDFTAQVYNDFSLVTKNFQAIFEEGRYDGVVGFFTSLPYSDYLSEQILQSLLPVRRQFPDRLFILSVLGPERNIRKLEEAGFLVVPDPTRAVEAVAAVTRIGRGFARGLPKSPDTSRMPRLEHGAINEVEAKRILASAGVPAAPERLATSAAEAVRAAQEIGFPVALKIVSPDILHKSDIGGVALGLNSAVAVRTAYADILKRCRKAHRKARIDGVLVAKMVAGGVETILGVKRDPVFGPVVMFGLGGIFAEVMKDVTFRLAPFDTTEATAMIREVKGYPLLAGARGRKPADVKALAKALSALSRFAAANAAVLDSIDINPLVVLEKGKGVAALDALIATREPKALRP